MTTDTVHGKPPIENPEDILHHLGQGVCAIDREGRLKWTNPKLDTYPAHAIENVRQGCEKLIPQYITELTRPGPSRPRRFYLEASAEYCFDVTATPVFNSAGELCGVIALVVDATASRRLQDKINAIDGAGAELVRLDTEALATMDVADRLALLEDKIIRYTHDLMHFDHFCVRVLDRRTNRLDTVVAGGMSEYAKSLPIHATSEGNGISGYVAATGRSYICADVTRDPRYLPGIDNARSSLTVPLRLNDQVVGILNVESEKIAAFTEDDRQFAEIFGRYVAVALHILKLLAVERSAVTGQITADVSCEISGPLNDILTDATTLMEDYIGHDDLRHRLHGVIDNVDKVKRTIQAMIEKRGIVGDGPARNACDPIISGKRILIADDEDIIRDTVCDVLTRLGAVTATARDGSEAIALIHAQPFDLVLSDIRMPHKDGYEIFAAVKQTSAHCPVILITGFGYDPSHSIVRASKEGLAGVLFKPFKVDQLLEDVRHALSTNVI